MSEERSERRARRATKPTSDPVAERRRRYRHLTNPFIFQQVFSDDEVASIHEAALGILEEQGMRVLSERARQAYKAGGAQVNEDTFMVRMDRGLVTECLAATPKTLTLHAGEPEWTMPLSGRSVAFAPTSGPPNIMDADRGRRAGTIEDFTNIIKICQMTDVLHTLGGCVEPQDVPTHIRHLQTTKIKLTYSDKIPLVYARGTGQNIDNFEMMRLAYGLSMEEYKSRPHTMTVINTNSPLQLDIPMAEGLMDYAEYGQVCIITPFTLAGAMAPVTIAGALTLAHAEALGGLTLSQIVKKGAPIMYGSFTSNVDMKSGAPAFGTPEYVKAAFGAGQMARYINLPWRSSSATASNCPDAQAAYESQMSLWGALMGGCNFMLHAAGWLEGGLTTSYEKFILDIEMLQMFAETFMPISAGPAERAVDAIKEVGPSGHFFGCAHTMERYRDAFYTPLVSDWRNYGQWTEAGGLTATQRANMIYKDMLKNYQPPAKDPARMEALNEYVERRTREGGAPPVS